MHCVSRGGCYLVNSYCDLHEENQWKKESYEACWLSLVLETRPQYNSNMLERRQTSLQLTLSEIDNIRRESYKQQQVIHFMVERSPSQTLRLGSSRGGMAEHQLPLFNTSQDLRHATATFGCTKQERLGTMNGSVDRQEVTAITKNLCKPVRENFRASSLMSSPRETSHRVQRRE